MSEETNELAGLFASLSRHPKFMIMMRMQAVSARLRTKSRRLGARGLLVELLNKEGVTNSEVTEILDVKPSSVSAQVKILEEKGYIYRQSDEADKRVIRIYLTEEGRKVATGLIQSQDGLSEPVFEPLSLEEQKDLIALLKKIVDQSESEDQEFFGNPIPDFMAEWGGPDFRERKDMNGPWAWPDRHWQMGRGMHPAWRHHGHRNFNSKNSPTRRQEGTRQDDWSDF